MDITFPFWMNRNEPAAAGQGVSFHGVGGGISTVPSRVDEARGKTSGAAFSSAYGGLDAAGQYAENLLQWLHRLPFSTTISVGQPARNKADRQVHFDKRKADPVESLACARFVRRGGSSGLRPRHTIRRSFNNCAMRWP
jgi:hypothetical protein